MSKGHDFLGRELKCYLCGRGFINNDDWVYKKKVGYIVRKFCSWHCLREFEKGHGTKLDRREKIIQAIKDGLSTPEISRLLSEEHSKIEHWRKKLQEAEENAGVVDDEYGEEIAEEDRS